MPRDSSSPVDAHPPEHDGVIPSDDPFLNDESWEAAIGNIAMAPNERCVYVRRTNCDYVRMQKFDNNGRLQRIRIFDMNSKQRIADPTDRSGTSKTMWSPFDDLGMSSSRVSSSTCHLAP